MKANNHEASDAPVTLTQLRKNVYQIVDDVIATGKPLTLTRNGCLLVLSVQSQQKSKLARLKSRNTIIGDIDGLETENSHDCAADSLCSDVPLITRDKTIIANLPNVVSAR